MSISTVNELVTLYFAATTGTNYTGQFTVLNNGVAVTSPSATITETTAPGIYVILFTPAATGRFAIVSAGKILGELEVVSKSIYSFLKNIEDEAIGSWTWNKQTGILDMIRQDGSTLASYEVVDTLTLASRERTS